MLTKIYEQNPSERELRKVVDALEDGGIIIYPTDSVYAFGCSLRSPKAIERLRRMKGKDAEAFTVVSKSGSGGRVLPGGQCGVPHPEAQPAGAFHVRIDGIVGHADKALEKRRTIGIRIPGNAVPRAIVAALGCPLITTSVKDDDEVVEYTTDPELIHERYGRDVALVIDGGVGDNVPTTVVDLTGDEPEILREGKGELQ